jgi:hypothetical protein
MASPSVDLNESPGRRALSRFASRVLAVGATPDAALTPLETRLLKLTAELFMNCVFCAQISKTMADPSRPTGQPVPIDPDIIGTGARFALAAAVEIEQPLRELRDKLEGRGEH